MFVQGTLPYIFNGQGMEVVKILFSSSLCLTDTYPVCSAVTRAMKTVLFDKGFDKTGCIAITCKPVMGKLFCAPGEDFGCKMTGLYPWEDEKARVVDDKVETCFSLGVIPTDPMVSGECPPCGCRERKSCKESLIA